MAGLKTWCFCCDLQSCAIFTGLMFLIFHVGSLVFCCLNFMSFINFFGYHQQERYNEYGNEPNHSGIAWLYFMTIFSIIGILINVTLVLSACKKAPKPLVPWLVFYGAILYTLPFIILIQAYNYIVNQEFRLSVVGFLIVFLFPVFLLAFWIYCWICILIFYLRLNKKGLKNEEKMEIAMAAEPIGESVPPSTSK